MDLFLRERVLFLLLKNVAPDYREEREQSQGDVEVVKNMRGLF
jgi:hypothetical protein